MKKIQMSSRGPRRPRNALRGRAVSTMRLLTDTSVEPALLPKSTCFQEPSSLRLLSVSGVGKGLASELIKGSRRPVWGALGCRGEGSGNEPPILVENTRV